jgi:hypothetical protein
MAAWITNKGWEEGVAGDWVISGSASIPLVDTDNPRTATYNLHFNTASSSTRWGRAKYTITDATLLAYLSGKAISFSVYRRCVSVFS